MFHFRQITLFCLEKRLSKHKITIFQNLGGITPLAPSGYAYGSDSLSIFCNKGTIKCCCLCRTLLLTIL